MPEAVKVTGMVLSTMPIGEYDRRIVLLTSDRGKINGFVRGARRPGNNMMAASQPFVFGEFMLYEGRNSYTFSSAKVTEYFDGLREDMEAMCYGSYFLELADYYARENEDSYEMLALLYLSVKNLVKAIIPKELIRSIYELRMLVINGEYPNFFSCGECGEKENLSHFSVRKRSMLCEKHASGTDLLKLGPASLYAAGFIVTTPVKKLFSFQLSGDALAELRLVLDRYMQSIIDKKFKSLEMLELLAQ